MVRQIVMKLGGELALLEEQFFLLLFVIHAFMQILKNRERCEFVDFSLRWPTLRREQDAAAAKTTWGKRGEQAGGAGGASTLSGTVNRPSRKSARAWQNSNCCSFLVRACGSSDETFRRTNLNAFMGTRDTSPYRLRAACSTSTNGTQCMRVSGIR